jgi:hypothetical protein
VALDTVYASAGRKPELARLRLDPGQAADIVWATNATEMYQLLVIQRGWPRGRYEHFLADIWHRLLLAD